MSVHVFMNEPLRARAVCMCNVCNSGSVPRKCGDAVGMCRGMVRGCKAWCVYAGNVACACMVRTFWGVVRVGRGACM